MLKIEGLSVSFGEQTVLQNLNWLVENSGLYSILGNSGCGKTTLLRCIAGLQEFSGAITLNGKPVTKPTREIAYMHQNHPDLPYLNVLNNVLYPVKLAGVVTMQDRTSAETILRKFGLSEHLRKYPIQLSGGMSQRLTLARVTMQNPHVLLLDEPFASLDEKLREELSQFLVEFSAQGKIIIMVTHDREMAERVSPGRILQLGGG